MSRCILSPLWAYGVLQTSMLARVRQAVKTRQTWGGVLIQKVKPEGPGTWEQRQGAKVKQALRDAGMRSLSRASGLSTLSDESEHGPSEETELGRCCRGCKRADLTLWRTHHPNHLNIFISGCLWSNPHSWSSLLWGIREGGPERVSSKCEFT